MIYLQPLQTIFTTAPLPAWVLILLMPMPIIVWGVDEIYRALRRNHSRPSIAPTVPHLPASVAADAPRTRGYQHLRKAD